MGTLDKKLQYLNDTKKQLKDIINYAGGGINGSTAFRNYSQQLYDNYNDILVDDGEKLFNTLPKRDDIDSASILNINDTIQSRMSLKLTPSVISQETTTGKNLLNINNVRYNLTQDTFTLLETGFKRVGTNLAAASYTVFSLGEGSKIAGKTVSFNIKVKNNLNANAGEWRATLYEGTGNNPDSERINTLGNTTYLNITANLSSNLNKTINIPSNTSNSIYLYIEKYPSSVTTNWDISFTDIMVVEGTYTSETMPDYEPYTGAIPSPNPDYPQDIHIVKGDNEITIRNKNLFDKNIYKTSTAYAYSDNLFNEDKIMIMSFKNKDTSIDISNLNFGFAIYDGLHTPTYYRWVIRDGVIRENTTNISTQDSNILCMQWFAYPNNAIETLTQRYDIQIELGATVTDYVGHQSQIFPVTLGGLEYCKIGDYADEFVKMVDKIQVPDEYTQVEYLESTGTQYIDTGYYHTTSRTNYELDITITSLSRSYQTLFGSRNTHDGNEAYYVGVYRDGQTYGCIGGNKKDPLGWNITIGQRYLVNINPSIGVSVNGTSYSIPYTASVFYSKPDYIFALNQNDNTIEYGSAKLYRMKILDNNALVRNFIPCYRNGDNKPGLYDTVNGVFYTNQGTGEFICGNIINKWYLKKNVGKVVLDGSEGDNWNYITGSNIPFRYTMTNTNIYTNQNTVVNAISNYYSSYAWNNTASKDYGMTSGTTNILSFRNKNITSENDWLLWLSTHNTTVYYVLATPEYILLNDTLQAQLNAIEHTKSYSEQTNMTQENDDLPFIITPIVVQKYTNIETTI